MYQICKNNKIFLEQRRAEFEINDCCSKTGRQIKAESTIELDAMLFTQSYVGTYEVFMCSIVI